MATDIKKIVDGLKTSVDNYANIELHSDITKVEGFANTEECINIIRKLVIEYKQNPSVVDVVINAISNISS